MILPDSFINYDEVFSIVCSWFQVKSTKVLQQVQRLRLQKRCIDNWAQMQNGHGIA